MKRIPDDILAILDDCTVEGNVVRINSGQLPRTTYQHINKVLLALGGKWNRKVQGHIFSGNPAADLESVILTGEYTNRKAEFGFFQTPDKLGDQIIAYADIKPGMTVGEPSAGCGALADKAAVIVGKDNVHVSEIQPELSKVLANKGYRSLLCADFLKCPPSPRFDRIVMNPPFAPNQADFDHVMHAWQFLVPGGRLVSIMSAGIVFRQTAKTNQLRELIDIHGRIEENEDGAFRSSGTMVLTVTVILDR